MSIAEGLVWDSAATGGKRQISSDYPSTLRTIFVYLHPISTVPHESSTSVAQPAKKYQREVRFSHVFCDFGFFWSRYPQYKNFVQSFLPSRLLIHEPLLCLREETEETGLIFYSLIFRSLRAGSNFGGFLEKTRGKKGCSNIFMRFKAPSCCYSFALF